MWNAAGLLLLQWCIIMPTIITAHNVHSIYKMGQTRWERTYWDHHLPWNLPTNSPISNLKPRIFPQSYIVMARQKSRGCWVEDRNISFNSGFIEWRNTFRVFADVERWNAWNALPYCILAEGTLVDFKNSFDAFHSIVSPFSLNNDFTADHWWWNIFLFGNIIRVSLSKYQNSIFSFTPKSLSYNYLPFQLSAGAVWHIVNSVRNQHTSLDSVSKWRWRWDFSKMTQHSMEYNSNVQMGVPLENWKVQGVVGEHFVSALVAVM